MSNQDVFLPNYGSWGDVYDRDAQGFEQIFINDDIVIFGGNTGYIAQGIIDAGVSLFLFDKKNWKDLGWVLTGYDTGGNCDPYSSTPCIKYSGTIRPINSNTMGMPDLIVEMEGTDYYFDPDGLGKVISAKNQTYKFDGEYYRKVDE